MGFKARQAIDVYEATGGYMVVVGGRPQPVEVNEGASLASIR